MRAALRRLISESHRASDVFDSIRSLFRRTDQERQPIDVNEVTLDVLKSLRGELADRGVTVETELSSELPLIEGRRSQLQRQFQTGPQRDRSDGCHDRSPSGCCG